MSSTALPELSRENLKTFTNVAPTRISNVEHLSSYDWIEASTPTIAVPGTPPLWKGSSQSKRLNKDSGHVYIAQNAARHPDSPVEPLLRALFSTHPTYDVSSVDIISDRNNIRKLLTFVDPSLDRKGVEDFTIIVEVIGNTAIFCRSETKTEEFIGPDDFRGYGHEFEKAYTTKQVAGSTGHHRIISCNLDDLKLIIRHETDGYTGITETEQPKQTGKDDISNVLDNMSLTSDPELETLPADSKLILQKAGQLVPLESTLEIKTRVHHKPIALSEVASQLWVSQTPQLVRAYHDYGTFRVPKVENVVDEVKQWEKEHEMDIGVLKLLLEKIVVAVKGVGSAVVKYESSTGKLVVRKAEEGRKMFPEDLYGKWKVAKAGVKESEVGEEDYDGLEKEVRAVEATIGHTPKRKVLNPPEPRQMIFPEESRRVMIPPEPRVLIDTEPRTAVIIPRNKLSSASKKDSVEEESGE